MEVYEARDHYRSTAVVERYDQQFRTVRTLRDLRTQFLGGFEERAFNGLLARADSGCKVLDVACGTGRYVRRLLNAGYQVVGTDISAEMLAVARARTPSQLGLLSFEQSDAAHLPFATGEFDGVTCMRLYHRVPAETRLEMLREVKRVGKRWAILFFGMTNPWLSVRRALRSAGGGRPTDPHPVTMAELRRDLDATGLRMTARRWVLPALADGLLVLAVPR
jgi:ubiquinone/menaquinone biosynthesis C-methylase UbiE